MKQTRHPYRARRSANCNNLSLTLGASNGTLILSASDNYTGGTIVTAGRLEVTSSEAIQSGTSLTVGAGASSIFGEAAPQTAAAVPEPGTLALLAVAGTVASAAIWPRKRN